MSERPFVDPDPTTAGEAPASTDAEAWERLRSLPSQDDAPVRWDARAQRFVTDDGRPAPRPRPSDDHAPPRGTPAVRADRSPAAAPRPPAPAPRADPDATRASPALAGEDRTAVMPRPVAAAGTAAATDVAGAPPPSRQAAPAPRRDQLVPGRNPAPGPRGSGTAPPPAPSGARRGGGGPGRRRTLRRVALGLVALFVVVVVAPLAFAWFQFQRIDRVDVGDALSPGGTGTNYLIVGSDSRESIDPDDPNAGAFLGEPVSGDRADTIIVLRVGAGEPRMLSIPRDLWVTNAATGEVGRVNSTFADGPGALIDTVEGLGIPIQHYVQIDFTSFGGLVDAVGGITIEVPHPARDEMSGLDIPEAGVVTLDGDQALAYVRSRAYTELIDGRWVTDPTGDLGRVERQRQFLTSLLSAVGQVRNPWVLRQVASALAPGLAIDDQLSFLDAVRLALDVGGSSPESVDLPVYGRTTTGGASVLELDQPAADEAIAGFAG